MKKFLFAFISPLLSFIFFVSSFYIDYDTVSVDKDLKKQDSPVIIIDAGHGGFDGGASSKDGAIIEKNINLKISLYLRDYLQIFGFKTVLTRETDKSLEDNEAAKIKERKTSDIHNRFKLMEEIDDSIFISIHQNFYPVSKYSGMQVFYSPDSEPESSRLASLIQASAVKSLQNGNTREIKKCDNSVYLIYNAVKPAVLVECGFLSNPEEALLLSDEKYQRKIAFCIAIGIEKYVSQG